MKGNTLHNNIYEKHADWENIKGKKNISMDSKGWKKWGMENVFQSWVWTAVI